MQAHTLHSTSEQKLQLATLAGGCFWCTEAIFQRLSGVDSVIPGYTGGTVSNPTYDQVCSGKTGHAEAIQIAFDPSVISYKKLLEIFFRLHNPTSLNHQDYDVGTAYRSAIFYHNEKQKREAEIAKAKIANVVTEVVPYTNFYKAEDYHQHYYEKNSSAPYCQVIIDPKIQKLLKEFSKNIKEEFR